jgi:hypothetical protein
MVHEPKHVITRKQIQELQRSLEIPVGPIGVYEIRQPLSDEVIQAKLKMIHELEERLKLELEEYQSNYSGIPDPTPKPVSLSEEKLLRRIEELESKVERMTLMQNVNASMETTRQNSEEQYRRKLNQELVDIFNAVGNSINRIIELNVKKY